MNLTLQDLIALKVVVELAIKRGAIQPEEMSAVGNLYDKMKHTIDHLIQQVKDDNEHVEDLPR